MKKSLILFSTTIFLHLSVVVPCTAIANEKGKSQISYEIQINHLPE